MTGACPKEEWALATNQGPTDVVAYVLARHKEVTIGFVAAALGQRALAEAATVRSHRAADDLRAPARFSAPHARITEVAELRDDIAQSISRR